MNILIVNLYHKIKKILVHTDIEVELQTVGSEYGGFNILDINTIKNVFSFGIGEDLSFSKGIIELYPSCNVYAFDPTPKSINYVRKDELYHNSRFHFYGIGLSDKNKWSKFFLPQNQDYVSGSEKNRIDLNDNYIKVKMYNIHTICKKLNKQNIDILKMDIEGSEFDVISGLKNKFEININQICLETHERFFRFGIIKLLRMNRILHRNGYLLVSIENDDYTYIRKELIEKNRKGHE